MLPKPQKEKTAAARISVPLLSIVKQEECEEGLNGDGMDVVRSSLIPNLEDFASRTQIDILLLCACFLIESINSSNMKK